MRTRREALDRKRHDPAFMVKGRNEPCSMAQVLEAVAGARGEGADGGAALAAQVLRNTEALFFPQDATPRSAGDGADDGRAGL